MGIASVAAIRGLPGHGAYCASKAGVVSYCESLRGELRAQRRQGGDAVPGLRRHAAHAANRYGMPFLMQPDDFADARLPRHRGGRELPRDSVADGRGRQAAADAAQRAVRPCCWPAGRASIASAER